MSVDLERATTRNLLVGLRAYMTTFDQQIEAAHREDALAILESGEYSTRATQFSDVLPRLQYYGFVTLLALLIETRLSVFWKVARDEYQVTPGPEPQPAEFLGRVHAFITEYLDATPPEELWRWIVDIAAVKDCVARYAGSVTSLPEADRRALNHIVRHRPGLEIEPDQRLYTPLPHPSRRVEQVLSIKRDFCLEGVTAAQGLFGYLYTHREPAVH